MEQRGGGNNDCLRTAEQYRAAWLVIGRSGAQSIWESVEGNFSHILGQAAMEYLRSLGENPIDKERLARLAKIDQENTARKEEARRKAKARR